MKQHTYEVTLKHIADAQGNPSTYTDTLSFNTYNHDDIFSEVILEHKNFPLFKDFMPHFGQFMKALKQTVKTQSQS